MNFILHSSELHIGSSIRYEHALYGNYFLNSYIVKIILISFNCFSEYIWYSNISIHKFVSCAATFSEKHIKLLLTNMGGENLHIFRSTPYRP